MTKLIITDYFWGFEYKSGRRTTEGIPNKKTGYHNIAGQARCFKKKMARDNWALTTGAERTAVSMRQLRALCKGFTIVEFNDYVLSIEDEK